MFVASLTDAELETLIVALKYWRSRRHDGSKRQKDSEAALVDGLVARLTAGILAPSPPEEGPADLISR